MIQPFESRVLLAFVAAASLPRAASGQSLVDLFRTPVYEFPNAVEIAFDDVTGDGIPDIVAALSYGIPPSDSSGVGLLRGTITGRFFAPVLATFDASQHGAAALATGDVTGDGRRDVVIANRSSHTVSVWRSNLQGTLDPGVSYDTGGNTPVAVAIGDVTGDGRPDVVVPNANSDNVAVLRGNAQGTLDPYVTYDLRASVPISVALGDVTGDGRPDVVVCTWISGLLCVLPGTAGGTLGAPVPYTTGGDGPSHAAIGDVTGDHIPDVVVTNRAAPSLAVLPGTARGTLGAPILHPTGFSPMRPIAGDFTGDQRPDVVLFELGSDTIALYPGNAQGDLDAPLRIPVGSGPLSIASGDVEGDGRQDLVATVSGWDSEGYQTYYVTILHAGPRGLLDVVATYAGGSGPGAEPSSLASGDVTRDGILDVIASNPGPGTVSVLAGHLDGSLAPEVSYPASGTGYSLLGFGDVSGDGIGDAVVLRSNPPTLSVLRGNSSGTLDPPSAFPIGGPNIGPPFVVGDLTGDPRADVIVSRGTAAAFSVLVSNNLGGFDAPVDYPTSSGLVDCAVGDLNADGRLDVVTVCFQTFSVQVWSGNAQGTLDAAIPYSTGLFYPTRVTVGDVTSDGRPDVVAFSDNERKVAVLAGNPQGTLDTAIRFPTGGYARGPVRIGDVSGDGRADLILGGSAVLRGNALGTFDPFESYLGPGTDYWPEDLTLVDIDQDGRLDLQTIAPAPQYSVALSKSALPSIHGTPFCPGDGSGRPCPCGNSGAAGRGCENSSATGGAILAMTGTSLLGLDDAHFTASGEKPVALSIFLQGSIRLGGVPFGDGIRCAGGSLKRLYVRNAVGGVVSFPESGDASVPARSAALGDPLAPGMQRSYQTYYRDAEGMFCPPPAGSTFNASSGMLVAWSP